MRVLIAVTHLLGAGHLTRCAALARALTARGNEVALVSGGLPAPLISTDEIEFIQLEPVQSDGADFRTLLDKEGGRAGAELLENRKAVLLKTLERFLPQVVITELFPFGRRVLAGEFMALLEGAYAQSPRPLIVSSVRDILAAPRRAGRVEETHDRLFRFYDAVLVHGDEILIPLDASWPVDEHLRGLLHYTGYVDEGVSTPTESAWAGILVSGGSSATSLPLYRAALEAARDIPDRPWRILVGSSVPEAAFGNMARAAPAHVNVERARRDFRALLAGAAVSVSQCGYNTAVDLLRTGTPAVLVPFEAGRETEQRLRAEQLRARGLADIIPEDALTPARLVCAVRERLDAPPTTWRPVSLDGGARSVQILEGFAPRAPTIRVALDWRAFDDALSKAADANRYESIAFWWRDDDAVADTPALRRLLDLSRRFEAPVALAAIPMKLEPSLASCLADGHRAFALVHGLAHANHAPPTEKKAEFGTQRPLPILLREAGEALRLARDALGPSLIPIFVPPWNRIAPDLVPALARLGYRGLSTFGDRRISPPGLVQVNTHFDPIDWRGMGGLVDPHVLIHRLATTIAGRLEMGGHEPEPVGLLTHHLVHDEKVWVFCEAVLERLARNNIRGKDARSVFSSARNFSEAARIITTP